MADYTPTADELAAHPGMRYDQSSGWIPVGGQFTPNQAQANYTPSAADMSAHPGMKFDYSSGWIPTSGQTATNFAQSAPGGPGAADYASHPGMRYDQSSGWIPGSAPSQATLGSAQAPMGFAPGGQAPGIPSPAAGSFPQASLTGQTAPIGGAVAGNIGQGTGGSFSQPVSSSSDWIGWLNNYPNLLKGYQQNLQNPNYHESLQAFAQRQFNQIGPQYGMNAPAGYMSPVQKTPLTGAAPMGPIPIPAQGYAASLLNSTLQGIPAAAQPGAAPPATAFPHLSFNGAAASGGGAPAGSGIDWSSLASNPQALAALGALYGPGGGGSAPTGPVQLPAQSTGQGTGSPSTPPPIPQLPNYPTSTPTPTPTGATGASATPPANARSGQIWIDPQGASHTYDESSKRWVKTPVRAVA